MFQIPMAIQMNTPLNLKPSRIDFRMFHSRILIHSLHKMKIWIQKGKQTDISLFRSYLQNCDENREIEDLSAEELNERCCTFVLSVRKRDGNEYEPSTLKRFSCSIDRYLKRHNSKFSLLNGSEFEKCRRVLQSKQKQLVYLSRAPSTDKFPSFHLIICTQYEWRKGTALSCIEWHWNRWR